jgi:hypothetical protein
MSFGVIMTCTGGDRMMRAGLSVMLAGRGATGPAGG